VEAGLHTGAEARALPEVPYFDGSGAGIGLAGDSAEDFDRGGSRIGSGAWTGGGVAARCAAGAARCSGRGGPSRPAARGWTLGLAGDSVTGSGGDAGARLAGVESLNWSDHAWNSHGIATSAIRPSPTHDSGRTNRSIASPSRPTAGNTTRGCVSTARDEKEGPDPTGPAFCG